MPYSYVGAGWSTCLSASTMWVLALEFRLLELVANTVVFICSTVDGEAQLLLSYVKSDILSWDL